MSQLEHFAATDFEVLLRESISEGMTKVLGRAATQVILYHLDLPNFDDAKKFHERLTAIFGDGTPSLERLILQELYDRTGGRPASSKDDDFVGQVELARRGSEGKLVVRHRGER